MSLRVRSFLLLIFLATGLFGLILQQVGQLHPLEDLFLHVTTPVQRLLTTGVQRVEDLIQLIRDIRDLQDRYEQLQKLTDATMIENVRLKEFQTEVTALRALLGFTQAHPENEYVGAEVIGRDPSNLSRYLVINVGTEKGITRGMPVVTERGLVGRVTDVGSNWAKVLLITDPSSSVNALIQRSRATGVVEGSMDGSLYLRYLPQGPGVVSKGDLVLTSGLGGNFPKRLVIGQVIAVQQRDVDPFQSATVRPTVDFDRLEFVLVITNFQPIKW